MNPANDILIKKLCLDGGTQSRGSLDEGNIADLRALIKYGIELDAIVVVYDGKQHYVVDGFHRVQACIREGIKAIRATIHQGTQRDAILMSCGANSKHGLQRSNEDKRRAVEKLLNDEEWSKWSNREIAKRCGVDEGTVRKYRQLSAEVPQMRTASRGAGSYSMDVSGLTRKAFDSLPESQRLKIQQDVEERARKKREEEERREQQAEEAKQEARSRTVEIVLPPELVQAIDQAARKAGRNREAEILNALSSHYNR